MQIAGQLCPEAVQLVRAGEVLFAGQDDIVPDGSEPVCPGDRVGGEGVELSQAPMWWTYRPVIKDMREGVQSGELQ